MEWRKIHRTKMEVLNCICISLGDTELASPGVGDENNKSKILKDPLPSY
jgi:hypothetical protein